MIGLQICCLRFSVLWKREQIFDTLKNEMFIFSEKGGIGTYVLQNKSRWTSFGTFSLIYKKRLTYTTFRSSDIRVWKNAYNSHFKCNLSIFQTSHKTIKGAIWFLSSNCIWQTLFCWHWWSWKLHLFSWSWPDLHYNLLKIASYDPMVN